PPEVERAGTRGSGVLAASPEVAQDGAGALLRLPEPRERRADGKRRRVARVDTGDDRAGGVARRLATEAASHEALDRLVVEPGRAGRHSRLGEDPELAAPPG